MTLYYRQRHTEVISVHDYEHQVIPVAVAINTRTCANQYVTDE
jgi:hypothetical protein